MYRLTDVRFRCMCCEHVIQDKRVTDVRKQIEDTQQTNDLKNKLELKLKHAQQNRDNIVKEIQERLKEHVSYSDLHVMSRLVLFV